MDTNRILKYCDELLLLIDGYKNSERVEGLCCISAYLNFNRELHFAGFIALLYDFRKTIDVPMGSYYWWIISQSRFSSYTDFINEWYRVRIEFINDFKIHVEKTTR